MFKNRQALESQFSINVINGLLQGVILIYYSNVLFPCLIDDK